MHKRIIVSGAGGAVGKQVVTQFLAEGYFVIGLYHGKVPKHPENNFIGYTVDLTDASLVREIIFQIVAEIGNVDVLACIAGGFSMDSIDNATATDIEKSFNLNFLSAYNLVQPVYRQMQQQGYGRIFLVGSRQGLRPELGKQSLSYTLSKSLLFSLATILNSGTGDNIVVSVVVPSIIDTPANRQSMPHADFSKWVSVQDIADAMVFYASEKANALREPIIKVFNQS